MQLPQAPTEIPPVRKYTREFNADRTKTYKEGDVFKINIPPIDKTYLTKHSKLYFDYDLSYNEATQAEVTAIFNGLETVEYDFDIGYGFFGYGPGSNLPSTTVKALNPASKIIPTLDINGAYGLISRIQVFDYLGNTLLEDVPAHDLLTATMNEFWFDSTSNTMLRPNVYGNEGISLSNATRKSTCTLPFNTADDLQVFLESPWPVQFNTVANTVTYVGPKKLPTLHCSLDLVSFLGLLSDKFVPLHNGFSISFTVNKANIPVCFNSYWDSSLSEETKNKVVLKAWKDGAEVLFTVTPSIVDSSISNARLYCDLLELSTELDSKVEKIIHSKMYKYQLDFLPTADQDSPLFYRRRLLPNLKSLTKVIIGQRYKPSGIKLQKNGFRIKNFIESSNLEYNKAKVSYINSSIEAFDKMTASLGNLPEYIQFSDFCVDETFYTVGYQRFNPLSFYLVNILKLLVVTGPGQPETLWFNQELFYPSNAIYDTYYGFQGKFLIVHNCSIPGATPNSVAGIDTSANVVEYTLESSSRDVQGVNVDVFMEHDAFIHVDPQKATAVSF